MVNVCIHQQRYLKLNTEKENTVLYVIIQKIPPRVYNYSHLSINIVLYTISAMTTVSNAASLES